VTRTYQVEGREGFARAWPVLHELRAHIDEETYYAYLDEMIPKGYTLLAREDDDGRIVALAGIGRGTNFYYGRYIWVFDLVTSDKVRSSGHGKALLDHVVELARQEGRDTVALSSSFSRKDAHRFYEEKAGFERAAYAFVKKVNEAG
jgi:GNAT superfamily N-acetyltransferase